MPITRGERILRELFTASVLARLEANARVPSKWVQDHPITRRLEVLRGRRGDDWRNRFRRRWALFMEAADACGLLEGKELRENLVSPQDDSFRGAMAECEAAWFLSRRLGAQVKAKPDPMSGKNVDLVATIGGLDVYCEVKSPHVPRTGPSVLGDDSAALRNCIHAATRQFKPGRFNLLMIVPLLRTAVFDDRDQFVAATIGQPTIQVTVSLDGAPPPPPQAGFQQDGKLARLRRDSNTGATRTDGTRISTICCLETQTVFDGDLSKEDHRLTVIHNPFAATPLPRSIFGTYPQLVKRPDGHMEWTDHHPD